MEIEKSVKPTGWGFRVSGMVYTGKREDLEWRRAGIEAFKLVCLRFGAEIFGVDICGC